MRQKLDRRRFLGVAGAGSAGLILPWEGGSPAHAGASAAAVNPPAEWLDPPQEFSQAPFWFGRTS